MLYQFVQDGVGHNVKKEVALFELYAFVWNSSIYDRQGSTDLPSFPYIRRHWATQPYFSLSDTARPA